MVKVRIKARVRVVVEVDVSDTWGGDCTMSQVNRQARTAALEELRRLIGPTANVALIAAPFVEAVVAEEEER
jgi:hypothetical protein